MNKVFNLIGLAQKAGYVSNGTEAARSSLINGRAFLLIMSSDIAENSRKDLLASAEKARVPWITAGNKDELGKSIGKEYRVAITINDGGMAKRIISESKMGAEANSTGVF